MSRHKATARTARRQIAEELKLLSKERDVELFTESEVKAQVAEAVESISDTRYRKVNDRIDALTGWVDKDWAYLSEAIGDVEGTAIGAVERANDALRMIDDCSALSSLEHQGLVDRVAQIEAVIKDLRAIFGGSTPSPCCVHGHTPRPATHSLLLPFFNELRSDEQS